MSNISEPLQESGSLVEKVNSFIDDMPGISPRYKNSYIKPELADLEIYQRTIEQMLSGNLSLASSIADSIDFQVVIFTDTSENHNRVYHILEKRESSNKHWGLFILNAAPKLKTLFIQSPHPKFDTGTGKQGIWIFTKTEAKAFYVSGAHRSNSDSPSDCGGTTTVYRDISEPFRISDQAHSVQSPLQFATKTLNSSINNLMVFQLHGFQKMDSDPYLILSNGNEIVPVTNRLERLKKHLLEQDDSLTIDIAHIDSAFLIGGTNVQGRLINGSPDPCNIPGTSNPDRFFHLEQEKYKIRENKAFWEHLSNAISLTFSSEED
ncbi:MAG: hypothetical protein IAE91_13480 [Ignavibacteriaceae bacterium]|nr:hypothetical protein [Ignavibacteriaceae bacterium]